MYPFDVDVFRDRNMDDPLGVGLRARARDNARLQNPTGLHEGFVLRDPQWDAFFQAMDEAGVDKVADQSVGERTGMFPMSGQSRPTFDARYQTMLPDTDRERMALSPSRQINAPSLMGLYSATGGYAPKGK